MSVHKPKLKNVPQKAQDAFVQHHLPYELWMMRESLAAAKNGAPTRVQQNLQVEGVALHARTIIEFLKNGKSCAFNPADFTTKAFSVNRNFINQSLLEMINEQVSHLTSDRTKNQNEKFDDVRWEETASAIEQELDRWVKNLSHDWAQKWNKRERMDEAAKLELNTLGHFGGACTAPTFALSNATGPTGPVSSSVMGD